MSIQWTVVAVVLYIEVAILALFLLPWIRPYMWHKLFKSRLVARLGKLCNTGAWVGIVILGLLFFDASREVRKYATADIGMMDKMFLTASSDSVVHMRLFRAQRNLYLSGFALFLGLVIRRVMALLSHDAMMQAAAGEAVKMNAGEEALRAQMNTLQSANRVLDDDLKTAIRDRDTLKKQAENLQREYERLAKQLTAHEGETDKKGD